MSFKELKKSVWLQMTKKQRDLLFCLAEDSALSIVHRDLTTSATPKGMTYIVANERLLIDGVGGVHGATVDSLLTAGVLVRKGPEIKLAPGINQSLLKRVFAQRVTRAELADLAQSMGLEFKFQRRPSVKNPPKGAKTDKNLIWIWVKNPKTQANEAFNVKTLNDHTIDVWKKKFEELWHVNGNR